MPGSSTVIVTARSFTSSETDVTVRAISPSSASRRSSKSCRKKGGPEARQLFEKFVGHRSVITGGLERTEPEYQALLDKAWIPGLRELCLRDGGERNGRPSGRCCRTRLEACVVGRSTCPRRHLLGAAIRRTMARSAGLLWPLHHLLQPFRPVPKGRSVGADHGRTCRRS